MFSWKSFKLARSACLAYLKLKWKKCLIIYLLCSYIFSISTSSTGLFRYKLLGYGRYATFELPKKGHWALYPVTIPAGIVIDSAIITGDLAVGFPLSFYNGIFKNPAGDRLTVQEIVEEQGPLVYPMLLFAQVIWFPVNFICYYFRLICPHGEWGLDYDAMMGDENTINILKIPDLTIPENLEICLRLKGDGPESSTGIVQDQSGNIYIVGDSKWGEIDHIKWRNKRSDLNKTQAFVVKCNSSGNPLWGTWIDPEVMHESLSVQMDTSGNLYVMGLSRIENDDFEIPTLKDSIRVLKMNTDGVFVWTEEIGISYKLSKQMEMKEYTNMVLKEGRLYLGASEYRFVINEKYASPNFDYSYVMCMDLDGNNLWKKKLDDFDLCKVCFLDVTDSEIVVLGNSDPAKFSRSIEAGRSFHLPLIEGSKSEKNGSFLAMKLDRETGKLQNYRYGFCSITDDDCIQSTPEGYLAWTARDKLDKICVTPGAPSYFVKIRSDFSIKKIPEKDLMPKKTKMGEIISDHTKFYASRIKRKSTTRFEHELVEYDQNFKVNHPSEPMIGRSRDQMKILMVDGEYIWILGDVVFERGKRDPESGEEYTDITLMRMKKSDLGEKREK